MFDNLTKTVIDNKKLEPDTNTVITDAAGTPYVNVHYIIRIVVNIDIISTGFYNNHWY